MKRPAFYIDLQRCTGCKTCMIACQDKNDLGPGVRWRRVMEYCGGDWFTPGDGTCTQNVFTYYLSVSCNHCDEPVCVQVCPTTAMHKDAAGIVQVEPDRCVGCRYCEWACPYSAPQYDARQGRMTKCDFCAADRSRGLDPACVAACPSRALDYGEYETLAVRSAVTGNVAPLPAPEMTAPGLVCRPSSNSRPPDSPGGRILNPEEVRDA